MAGLALTSERLVAARLDSPIVAGASVQRPLASLSSVLPLTGYDTGQATSSSASLCFGASKANQGAVQVTIRQADTSLTHVGCPDTASAQVR